MRTRQFVTLPSGAAAWGISGRDGENEATSLLKPLAVGRASLTFEFGIAIVIARVFEDNRSRR